MNLAEFFKHWQITDNPFRGEEARHDAVFDRVGREGGGSTHSEFEKVLGDLHHPSTAVVFGEKGSGKTAMRLQLADRVRTHNAAHPDHRVLMVPYDDLNAVLDRFAARVLAAGKAKDAGEAFERFRLVDHMDAILSIATGRVINALVPGSETPSPADLGDDASRRVRAMPAGARQDLLVLQAVYDQNDLDGSRTRRLRRLLRLPVAWSRVWWGAGTLLGWIPAAAVVAWMVFGFEQRTGLLYTLAQSLLVIAIVAYLGVLAKTQLWDRGQMRRTAGRVHRQLRTLGRPPEAIAKSLSAVPTSMRTASTLPSNSSEEPRYAMLDRVRRVLGHFGYTGMLVVVDRVDEPAQINGDADRMRAIIWPLFNSKFLQQERIGFKMLLPIELRYALFKESNAFFQEARLDKQNLVERLTWTGAMLYDLCTARLRSCLAPGAEELSLLSLFADDVSRQDLVDALDQMHQPRDAFKFLYRCLNEHCSNVTAEEEAWRVPRLVLEHVRKQEADRVQQLERGIRPA